MDAERVAQLIGSSFDVGITEMQDFYGRRYLLEIGEFTGEVQDGLPVVHPVFEGGADVDYRPNLVADRSVHEERFRRAGVSFDSVLKAERGAGG